MSLLPQIAKPERKIRFQEKLLWTAVTLFIFLVFSQVPIFGIMSSESSDPFYWLRAILASNRGTLMELGTSPLITAGMVMQVLTMAELFKIDNNIKEDRLLYAGAEKLLTLTLTFGQAVVQVVSGFYGNPKEIGAGVCLLLVAQLFLAGVVIVLLDELLEKGYGLGSGVSLFIASNVCENIFWQSFSPTIHKTGKGTEFEGAIIAVIHLFFVRKNKLLALKEAFFRPNLPNLSNILATIFIFLVITYLQGIRYELPVVSTQARHQSTYPIKLFYTSNMPVMLQTTMISHVLFFSQLLYKWFPKNIFVRLLGVWELKQRGNNLQPVSGLSYYITSPSGFTEFLLKPIRSIIYLIFFLGACSLLSRLWIELSGTAPKDVAKRLKEQGLTLKGQRDVSNQKELKRIIPIAASLGGVMIALVSVGADLLGAIGSGTGLLLATTTIYQYFELFAKETAELSGYKAITF